METRVGALKLGDTDPIFRDRVKETLMNAWIKLSKSQDDQGS